MQILGVGGFSGSGKDTVADYLVSKYGWKRDAFADRLRKGLLALDPIVLNDKGQFYSLSEIVGHYGWDVAKRENKMVRELQQRYGDEAGRQIHGENCWVWALLDNYESDTDISLVISDVRYPNEILAVRNRGGTLLWVDRPGVGPVNAHASDNSVGPTDFDYTVVNDGSLEELYAKVDRLVKDRLS